MASIPSFRFDITGASGSQGLLTPKSGWFAYVFPRGANASQDSTGTLITFDSSDIASRFTVNNWIQVGTDTAKIVKVTAVGGNSISVNAAVTVTENDRVFLIGNTQPSVSGGSATYITPNTLIRQRGDDGADLYTNSLITTNVDGLVQGYASPSMYDVMVQDGNQSNQGYIADLEVGTVEGVSVIDAAIFGATVTITSNVLVSGTGRIPRLGPLSGASTGNAIRIVEDSTFTSIQAAINDLPPTGGAVYLGSSFTVTSTITVRPNVTIIGSPSAMITKGFNGSIFTMSGANSRLIDVAMDGALGSFTGDCVTISASNCEVRGCSIANYYSSAVLATGTAGTITGTRIIDNRMTSGSGSHALPIFCTRDARNNIIEGNFVDNSLDTGASGTAILCASVAAGQNVNNSIVRGNFVQSGTAGVGIGFTKNGGASPGNGVVSDNIVITPAGSASTAIGISIEGATACVVSGNVVDAKADVIGIGIEITNSADCRVSSNTIRGGTQLTAGIQVSNGAQRNIITSNTIDGFLTSTSGRGIHVTVNNATSTLDNIVSDNVIAFPAAGAGVGIHIQANFAGGNTSRNRVSGNIIEGVGAASSQGIQISADVGTADRNSVVGNLIYNVISGLVGAAYSNTGTNKHWADNVLDTVTQGFGRTAQAIGGTTDTILFTTSEYCAITGITATLGATPTIVDGYDGQEIDIINEGSATITLQDQGTLPSSNLRLGAATRALAPRDNMRLRYNATIGDWIERYFSNVT